MKIPKRTKGWIFLIKSQIFLSHSIKSFFKSNEIFWYSIFEENNWAFSSCLQIFSKIKSVIIAADKAKSQNKSAGLIAGVAKRKVMAGLKPAPLFNDGK